MGKLEKPCQESVLKALLMPNKTAVKKEMVRQFLIRKKCSLELMYTNGLTHWTDHVANSEVKLPFMISDVSLSKDN